jgi:hypothetical protein
MRLIVVASCGWKSSSSKAPQGTKCADLMLGVSTRSVLMPNEFEWGAEEGRKEAVQSKASEMYSEAKSQVSEAARNASDAVRENPGTASSIAVVFGIAGFALGFMCGQGSARSQRYWR